MGRKLNFSLFKFYSLLYFLALINEVDVVLISAVTDILKFV